MKFLVDNNIKSEGRELNFIDVGIHDNVELTEVKVDSSPKGNNFLAFTFTSEDGKQLTKTEWEPIVSGNEDDVLKKAQNQAKRIKHIMTKFLPEEQTVIEYDTDNFSKYASTVKAKLDPVIKGVKLRIKATYDSKNYVTLPNYIPFVERMDSDKQTLNISSIDKMIKEEADQESVVTNPIEDLSSTDSPQLKESLPNSNPRDNSDLDDLVDQIESTNKNELPF